MVVGDDDDDDNDNDDDDVGGGGSGGGGGGGGGDGRKELTAAQSRCGRGCSSLSVRRAVHIRGSRSTWGELSAASRDRTRLSFTSLSCAARYIYTYIYIYIYTTVCRGWLPPWKREENTTRGEGGRGASPRERTATGSP